MGIFNMKDFFNSLNWFKFVKYVGSFTAVVWLLYFTGNNTYPENAYILYTAPLVYVIVIMVRSFFDYKQYQKYKNQKETEEK